ncbi:phosphoglucomutase, alpha-D-glucose phosphate-specific [Halomonas sp. TRM85114]|uniref:phosphoglucomutase, alpha-D-glucose phosphate-specific n=1 Tax=Halomonas jincaotanensis TaxID=2810616 RepID=UPI001BD3EC05|nr:phosphoglucomutase, alpha-D-glucose phosphate-specific [Halomonas jincaotanensis]MBS9404243.1 phosphoglucomutase, alpha-D-glucose phosphate-specific [Halomonas jincaotanensis]
MQQILQAFDDIHPDPSEPGQAVDFGTSGHRGRALAGSFNRGHILAITQAVVDYRRAAGITGPLFLGRDSHALSRPAWECALGVLVANGVAVRIERDGELTATPLVSRAILQHNARPGVAFADGLIITPSHNPPEDGGIKYNPPHGGPAEGEITGEIERRANAYLAAGLDGASSMALDEALAGAERHDMLGDYVAALDEVVDMAAIADAGLKLGADPMGGTALPVWQAIAARYGLALEVVNTELDEAFAFMPPDHDGRIRMDCSSPAAMANLLAMKSRFDLAFGNDPDADRHGIVDADGLMNPNHYLAVAVDYLLTHRPSWPETLRVGKTLVSSSLIDRVVAARGRPLHEVPVGFKWFVEGLHEGWLAFGGEESAGASFLTFDGRPWSTDKDGILLCLLAAEIMAVTGRRPSDAYQMLTTYHGRPHYRRVDTPCSRAQQQAFKGLDPSALAIERLAGDPVEQILTTAPGNRAPIGGLKVITTNGWFAARPSGTEPLYKVYAESFVSEAHLERLIEEAQACLAAALRDE